LALLRERATVSLDETRAGSLSDWVFVGGIMVVLAGLAAGSIFVSFYFLLPRLVELLYQVYEAIRI
jgi:hypothetical protein